MSESCQLLPTSGNSSVEMEHLRGLSREVKMLSYGPGVWVGHMPLAPRSPSSFVPSPALV